MQNSPRRPIPNSPNQDRQGSKQSKGDDRNASEIALTIINTINALQGGLKDYPIRQLVEHAEQFGPALKEQKLETNQIRKFLDAINQIKAKLSQIEEEVNQLKLTDAEKAKQRFIRIEEDVVLLKPKLAYAAARQDAVKALNKVMSGAIDKVHSEEDFGRLVQLMEAIIAYHKAKDGE